MQEFNVNLKVELEFLYSFRRGLRLTRHIPLRVDVNGSAPRERLSLNFTSISVFFVGHQIDNLTVE